MLEMCDDDLEIVQTELLPWGGGYRGQQGLLGFLTKLTENVDAHPKPLAYVEAGEQVAVYGRLLGKVRHNGNSIDLRIVHIWTVSGGKVKRFEAYIDTPAMLKALNGG